MKLAKDKNVWAPCGAHEHDRWDIPCLGGKDFDQWDFFRLGLAIRNLIFMAILTG